MEKLVLLVQAASTWAMVGLIWFVQIVHYPLFARVGGAEFSAYEQLHQRLTTLVVAPLMFAELGVAIWLCWSGSDVLPAWQTWLGLGLVIVIWLSTAVLQVPAHEALANDFSVEQHAKLVGTNWIRTVAWSMRGVLVLWMLSQTAKI
ncbi:MAG: hypothetical protein AAGD11_08520 [Planctomycetota bacterium]